MRVFFSILLIIIGAIILLATFSWLAFYIIETKFEAASLGLIFSNELWYWLPVAFFSIPGILFIYHGLSLLKNKKLSFISFGEIVFMFATLGIIAAIVQPVDNFSYVAATIVRDGIKATDPLQKKVEQYYSENDQFPDSEIILERFIPDDNFMKHVRNISVGKGARIIITFDTRDIDWGWKWWHRYFLLKPNDLTEQTLILVPHFVANEIVWDECEEGTVPKRNRHYKCSGHK